MSAPKVKYAETADNGVPEGGTEGQVLTKQAGGYGWEDPTGGGGSYTLPQASESALGGIKAANKTSAETQEVKIDPATGKLYVPPADAAANGLPPGGSSGQILKKNSSANYDAVWADGNNAETVEVPAGIQYTDNLDGDSHYVMASANVTSTATIDPNLHTLTIAAPNDYDKSGQTNLHLFGRNIMINTVFTNSAGAAQIQMRLNTADGLGALVWYKEQSSAALNLAKIAGSFTLLVSGITFDGSGSADTEISVRAFEDMSEVYARQGADIIAMYRYYDTAFNALTGKYHGLGASSTSVYKTYVKSSVLKEYINVLCVGDSNTYGQGLSLKQKYPSKLMRYYFEKNVGVMNKGVTGNNVADVANRMFSDIYTGYLNKARNIAIIQIGTNDAAAGTAATTIYSSIINKLVLPMKDAGFEVWLVTVPVRTDNGSALTIVRALNTLIRSDTNADKIIDFYAETVDGQDTAIPGMLQADGLHLTETACGILAELISDEL